MTDHLKPVRTWLREIGATHVVIEGSRIPRRRLSVDYALAQLRNLHIVSARVQRDRTGTAAILSGVDPITQTVRTVAAVHSPTIRVDDGHDENGRPTFHHLSCERTTP